ncbi:hypothetical protein CICLE_v10006697mg [Citrus x clementina]|uniref:Major facilitator superfamily (MFS) profile domain-containing protein n=1 Tax=Citrus clementina TaxID=85681 RepID=V4S584_CITCL|nr:hypothetical protein CICLE_v10006697mg [Citrus x clementina]
MEHSATPLIPVYQLGLDDQISPVVSLDEMIEQNLANLGLPQFIQVILISLLLIFESQQTFISVYTDEEPTWHCINNTTTCSSSSDICTLSKSAWAWDRSSDTTIISDWSLECAGSSILSGLPSSCFFIGCLLGGLALSTLGDSSSLGRKKLLFLSCFAMSITALATIFANNIWIYSTLRFVAGFFRAPIMTSVIVLLSKMVSKRWRGQVVIIGFTFFSFGLVSLPAVAYLNRGSSWKMLYVWTSIPSIVCCIIIYPFISESPRWLFIHGHEAEAMAVLKRLASRLLTIMALAFGIGVVYFGLLLGVGNLSFNIYLSLAFNGLLDIPAYLLTFILIERWSRKSSILTFCILSGTCSAICVAIGDEQEVLQIGLELASFFSACVAFNVLLVFGTELFPTCVRNSTTSLVRQAVNLGAAFSPVLISAGRQNEFLSFGVFGLVVFCFGFFVVFLPETIGVTLCDTLDQQEYFKTGGELYHTMADPSPLLCQSNSCTDDQESSDQRSHKQSISSLDEIVEQGIGGFGWAQFQSFISVYTEAEPTWHCLNNTTCSSASNICMFPKSSWAWDGNPTTTALTIISEWGLECSSAFIKGLPAASHFTGCLLGIVFLATLADSSLGRKNLLFLSCLTMSVATSLTIFSNNLWIYSLLRFFSGISRATIGTCTIVLLTEKVGTEWRGLVGILDSFFFTIGTLTLPAIAYTNRSSSWTIIYLWTSIPTLVYSGLLYIFVSESPRWLFMQGRQEEAVEVIKSLSPIKDSNQLSLSLVSAVSFGHEPAASSKESSFLSSIRELFVRRWALERTLALMVLGFGIGVVYYGMTLGIENLGFDIYLGVVFNALLEIPVWGIYFDKTSHDEQVSDSRIPRTENQNLASTIPSFFLTFFLIQKWNRKSSLLVLFIISGICSIMAVVANDISNAGKRMRIGLELASLFSAYIAYTVIFIYAIELFPTCVRNSATSIMRLAIIFAAIFSSVLVAAGSNNEFVSYGVFGLVIICCGFFVICLPETRGSSLCDTIDQREHKDSVTV